jgi:hypothetical protein
MVPSSFVVIPALPTLPNGKVDQRSLPEPLSFEQEAPGYLPRTEAERAVAAVWQEVLQIASVRVADNFFDIGGTSLLLLKVQSGLQAVFQCDLAVSTLFEYPTVEALAYYLSQREDQLVASQSETRADLRAQRTKALRDLRGALRTRSEESNHE